LGFIKGLKKTVESIQDLFKILIWVFLIVVSLFIFYKVFNFFLKIQENKKVLELKNEIEHYIKNEEEFFVDMDYLCFSSSFNEKKLKNIGINLKFNDKNLKIVGENMKYYIKNGQAPVIVVNNNKIYHFYIEDLIFSEPVPVCFKKGDKIKITKKFGGKTVVKTY